MIVVSEIAAIRAQTKQWKTQGQSVAFVPTMGNLHAGHLSLVARARQLADRVVVSIFVNPLQFNENSDYETYPRSLAQDKESLQSAHTDVLFMPDINEIYPQGQDGSSKVIVPELSDLLEGACRPGHFTGVATVVNKLFNIVQPHVACFGEKDFQQLMLIRRMVEELNIPVDIVAVATLREDNGLAMSSRNNRLTESQRNTASALYQALQRIQKTLEQGDRGYLSLEKEALGGISQQGLEPEYVTIRRSFDLGLPTETDKELVILVAARLGDVRLIDNIALNL